MKPGERVYEIGTIHVNLHEAACVVELHHGVVANDGDAMMASKNIIVPWSDELDRAYAILTKCVADAVTPKGAVPYVRLKAEDTTE